MAVYFIQEVSDRGHIKIGYAAYVETRFDKIQSMSPSQLDLKGFIPDGDHDLERAIHKHFKDSRLHGEWFKPSAELSDFIWRYRNADAKAVRRYLGIDKNNRSTRKVLRESAPEIAVEILAATIKEMKDAGLMVAVKNVTAKPDRPAGVIIYVGDITLAGGALVYAPLAEPATEPQ